MDRNEFLNLCREVSKLPEGVLHIRENVPKTLQVMYGGSAYYPVTFYYEFINGTPMSRAVLHSLKTNSFMHVPLKDVTNL